MIPGQILGRRRLQLFGIAAGVAGVVVGLPALVASSLGANTQPGGPAGASNDESYLFATTKGIFELAVDTRQLEQISDLTGVASPVWSPDGSTIAFSGYLADPENSDIYTIDVSSREVSRITTDPRNDTGPEWAPDGTSIAFERTGPDGHAELFITAAELGGEERQLTNNSVIDAQPAWSPDGTSIAFTRKVGAESDIYVLDIADGTEKPMASSPSGETSPAWSPDGKSIVFVRDEEGTSEPTPAKSSVFVADATDGKETRITDPDFQYINPLWKTPDSISYVRFDAKTGEAIATRHLPTGKETIIAPGTGVIFDWSVR